MMKVESSNFRGPKGGYRAPRTGYVYPLTPMRKLNPRQKTQVKRIAGSNVEMKDFPIFSANKVDVTTTWQIQDLLGIAQGNNESERDGTEVKLKTISLRYGWSLKPSVDVTAFCRIILFQWKQNDNATTPVITDIMYDPNSLVNPAWFSPYRYDTTQNYRIIYDRIHVIQAAGPSGAFKNVKNLTKNFAKRVRFDTGTIKGTNKIYLAVVTDFNAGGQPPEFEYYGTIRYIDA